MKKIKLFPAPHLELRISVSDEMIKDFRECRKMASESKFEECKDCDTCSWRDVVFEDTGICELPVMEQLMEENVDEMQRLQ